MHNVIKHLYEFGPFVLDPGERLLLHGASRMELPPRVFDTLLVLVENNGRLLEKDALMRTVWGDTVVEENNLSQAIYLLRKALRDGEDGTRYIETVPKRGYRFVGGVREIEASNGNGEAERLDVSELLVVSGKNHDLIPAAMPPEAKEPVGRTTSLNVSRYSKPSVSNLDTGSSWSLGIAELAVICIALLLAAAGWERGFFADSSSAPIRSVAVLALQNLSNDPTQEYFVDGMTDELITDLAQIRELKVVSKTSVMRYKGTQTSLSQIGRDLGVDAVVEGSVLRSGDNVRITAQLIRAASDRHIWAKAYDGDLKDVLSLQARVAEAITNEVKLNLTAQESGRLRAEKAVDPEAFDLYLRGRFVWNQRNIEGFKKAIDYFNQALAKDPNFALAYSGLADSHTLLTLYGESPTHLTDAKTAAEKALLLDPSLAEAHTSLAAVRILHDWDWIGAEREFQRAIELNPNYAQAHQWYGNLLLGPQGRHNEAIAELLRARDLDPLSLIINADTGFAYYLAGRNDLAIQTYQKVLAINPNFVPVHFYLSKYYEQAGQYDLWLKEITADDRLAGFSSSADYIEQTYAHGGFHAVMDAMAAPDRIIKLTNYKNLRIDPCTSAGANVVLGRDETALNELENCYRGAQLSLIYLKVDPVWTRLHSEPRYQDLLRRIGLQ
jgi:TolB-like protein/DNA-binding winged helix-turn-helix (wHTH) protein/Tfp pilus assembly protein PilF